MVPSFLRILAVHRAVHRAVLPAVLFCFGSSHRPDLEVVLPADSLNFRAELKAVLAVEPEAPL